MNTQRKQIKIEPLHIEYLIREVEAQARKLEVLSAESKIVHGFLGLCDKLTNEVRRGETDYNPLRDAKKALEAGIFELTNKTSQN